MKTIFTILLSCFCLSLHAGVTVYSAPNETGLVGYWKMDEPSPTTIDYSGKGNNGTNVGGVTLTNGVIGSSAAFVSASSKYVSTANILATNNWSYAFWCKRNSFSTVQGIISQANTVSSGRNITIYFTTSPNNHLQIDIPYVAAIFSSTAAISDSAWRHYVITKSGTSWAIYINGTLDNSTTSSTGQEVSSAPLLIGATSVGSIAYMNGFIDDVRIYNRALSATEITNLYNFRQTTFLTNGVTGYKP